MRIQELAVKLINKTKGLVDKLMRDIDETKRLEIAESFQSTVNFLMNRTKNGKGLTWLDQLKYLDRNPFVDTIKDIPTVFTKGREHKISVRLVQTNYRIKKNGEVFLLDPGEDTGLERCKSYEFIYSYYKPQQQKKDNEVKLYFWGFNINMTHDKEAKTHVVYKENGV